MLEVKIKDDSTASFEKGMKIFKKICQNDGFMLELRERKSFKKPSKKRHEKIQEIMRKREQEKGKRK